MFSDCCWVGGVDPIYVPGSKLVVLGMVIQPLIGNPYSGYINPYYWVDDHPLLYGNNGSLDPGTYRVSFGFCCVSCLFLPLCHINSIMNQSFDTVTIQ